MPHMIKKLSITAMLTAVLALFATATQAAPSTMRLDYYHSGNASQEIFSPDRVVIEPLPWPGNPQKLTDDTNLGKYLFEVIERGTNRVLYSRGFASASGRRPMKPKAPTRRFTNRCASLLPHRRSTSS